MIGRAADTLCGSWTSDLDLDRHAVHTAHTEEVVS
jgi:hypothetical protein